MRAGGNNGQQGFFLLASFGIVAAILYFAKAVFIPIAVATLFTFLLSPLVVRLQKWKFPKAAAVITTATLAFGVVAFITWLVTTQVLALAEQLPRYEQNLHTKVRSLKVSQGPGPLSRAADVIKGVQKDFESAPPTDDSAADRGTPDKPMTVEVKAPKPTLVQMLRSAVGPLLSPIATAGIVVLLVIAMLFKREDLRDRFIKVISRGQLNVATEAVDDAGRRISRYLLMLLIVNVTYGLPVGAGLYFIGVPNALLWGVLATLLRFIPYAGPWIAAAFPIGLAFVVDPGWSKVVLSLGLFITMELISNNFIEPWLYGSGTGVSVVAVIGGAVFWTWLWGGVGLFLATPLTVCVVVMGKYVPGLKFLNDLFGSDPVLEPPARLYQRMLAMDYEEMLRMAEQHLETADLTAFYDQVMIPALIFAEEDRQTGTLAEVRQQFIVQNSRELIDELGERDPTRREGDLLRPAAGPRVLCLPAKDDADEIAARMLVQVLAAHGIAAELLPATFQPSQCNDLVSQGNIRAVVVSGLPPAALAPARRLCRRLKQACPTLTVVVGVWTPQAATTDLMQRLAAVHPDAVVTTLKGTVQQIEALAEPGARPSPATVAQTRRDLARPSAAEHEVDELFDRIKRRVARLFEVPLGFVSIVEFDAQFWKEHGPTAPADDESNGLLRDSAVCSQVTDSTEPIIVQNVSEDKRLAEDGFLRSRGIQAYVSWPLRTRSGHAVGSLCVLDTKPREVTPEVQRELARLTAQLMAGVEEHALQAT